MTMRGDSRNDSEVGFAIADGKLGTVQYFIYIIFYAEPEVSATAAANTFFHIVAEPKDSATIIASE
jgi:hypothetical protein